MASEITAVPPRPIVEVQRHHVNISQSTDVVVRLGRNCAKSMLEVCRFFGYVFGGGAAGAIGAVGTMAMMGTGVRSTPSGPSDWAALIGVGIVGAIGGAAGGAMKYFSDRAERIESAQSERATVRENTAERTDIDPHTLSA